MARAIGPAGRGRVTVVAGRCDGSTGFGTARRHDMTAPRPAPQNGRLVGAGASVGGALGLVASLLLSFQVLLGMVTGVAVGVLVGVAADALVSHRGNGQGDRP
jgi:hypothetical protein